MGVQTKDRIKKVMILLVIFLVIFNMYFYFSQTYISVQDNLNDKHILTVKYSELLDLDDSIANQICLYLTDEPAEEDSRTFEKIGVYCVFASIVILILGLISFYKKEKYGLLITGAVASSVGTGCLYMIVNTTQTTIRESMIGTMESIFGKGSVLDIKSSAGTYAFIDIIVNVAICILIYYYYKISTSSKQSDENQNPNTENFTGENNNESGKLC